jgi:hypothetical protein
MMPAELCDRTDGPLPRDSILRVPRADKPQTAIA